MKKVERFGITLGSILLLMCIGMVTDRIGAQTISIGPGVPLNQCKAPSLGTLHQCNVSGDPANPDGLYVSVNGGAYQKSGGGPQGPPGPKGDPGATGPAGAQGAAGLPGKDATLVGSVCRFNITSFTMDGKGGASGVMTITSCP